MASSLYVNPGAEAEFSCIFIKILGVMYMARSFILSAGLIMYVICTLFL